MPYLSDAMMRQIEADLAAAHRSLVHGELRMPTPPAPANGVYQGLVRPRPPRDPATSALLAKLAGDLRAVATFAARAVVESGALRTVADADAPAPAAVATDAHGREVIEAEFEEEER